MRISDWSSDVCSSDLQLFAVEKAICQAKRTLIQDHIDHCLEDTVQALTRDDRAPLEQVKQIDRKSVGEGKSVAVRVELGGRRNIKKKTNIDVVSVRVY